MYYSMTFIPYTPNVGNRAQPLFWDLTYDRNTWEHWHIVPTERPVIAPPTLKTHYVDIPGANGKIDLNQSLTEYPTYNNRAGSIEFAVLNGYRHWQTAYTDIMTTVHGKRLLMVYEEDPEYYYVGRWSVNKWKTSKTRSSITLDYDLEPYKWRLYDAQGSWLWDPFNFNTGVIPQRHDGGFYRTRVTLNGDNITETLLYTQAFSGDNVVDNIAEGKLYSQENVSNIIGNAPITLELHIYPSEGKTITLNLTNPEFSNRIDTTKTYTAVYNGTDEDFIITNWTGSNGMTFNASGFGTVNWNFRPGRL